MRDYEFGNHLTDLRKERGYSQFQLAKLVGVSDKSISKWETGVAKPRANTCRKLAAALGINIGDLYSFMECDLPTGGTNMSKKSLWHEAEEKLFAQYGDEPDLLIIDRFKEEEALLRDTEAIAFFATVSKVRRLSDDKNSLINVRGVVNGSFVAWLLGATAFNPLPAHTYCPSCKKTTFYPDVKDGWDLPNNNCDCGSALIRDGHDLPIGAYYEKSKSNFSTIDCTIDSQIAKQAWKIILESNRDNYRCERFVYRQSEDTGFPGEFSRLYLHEGKSSENYQDIDDVPIVSEKMNWHYLGDVPSILLLEDASGHMKYDKLPKVEDILDQRIIQCSMNKHCKEIYCSIEEYSFYNYVQSLAATSNTFEEGTDIIKFSKEAGLKSFLDLPLTREDVWNMIIKSPHGNAGFASDILHNMRRGKYTKSISQRDIDIMIRIGLPNWFPHFAASVKYLFPKAHCIDFAYRFLVEEFNLQK